MMAYYLHAWQRTLQLYTFESLNPEPRHRFKCFLLYSLKNIQSTFACVAAYTLHCIRLEGFKTTTKASIQVLSFACKKIQSTVASCSVHCAALYGVEYVGAYCSSGPMAGWDDLVKAWSQWGDVMLILLEVCLGILIIEYVPYTEIDWQAYMSQLDTIRQGERDYLQIRGSTGPLVYPAGFVYIYGILYALTQGGLAIRCAQYIFLGLYLVQLVLVLHLYRKSSQVPAWALVLLVCSKRMHSLYILRLFNDPVAMLFAYAAIGAFVHQRVRVSTQRV